MNIPISELHDTKYTKDVYAKFEKKINNINRIIEKIEKKNSKKNGFKDFDIENMYEIRLKNGQIHQIEIDNLMKKTLFDFVKNGELEKVDDLLSIPKMDIDITWYSENLLMHAIRYKNEKIAEFLIFKGINFNYEAKLMEFNEKTNSLSYNSYSCRQMAYDNELYDIVDLIDIFKGQSNKNLRLFLINRYLNNMNRKFKENEIFHKILKKRIDIGLENNLNNTLLQNDSFLYNDSSVSEDIDKYKPLSKTKEENLDKTEVNKLDSNKNTSSSHFQTYSEIDENFSKNFFEFKRTGSTLIKITNDRLDIRKNNNYQIKSKITGIKSTSDFKNASKSKFFKTNANLAIFEQKTIFYTKRNENVVPINKLNNKFLTKSLTNMKNFYYIKNLEKIHSNKANTETYYAKKSLNLTYP